MATYKLCVKDDVYARLVEKARSKGMSVGKYLNELIRKDLEEG